VNRARPRHLPVLVVGAGPAGLAAAATAASHGLRVALVDQQASAGGQVWRPDVRAGQPRGVRRRLQHSAIDWYGEARIVHAEPGFVWLEQPSGPVELRAEQIVLATGARELLLPFPGWTLPGVLGAGGAQALAKQGWDVRGRRVVVAGSGPLLLAAAATLRRHGAHVLEILENSPREELAQFAGGLWRWPGKAVDAAGLMLSLLGVPYRCGHRIVSASGEHQLEAIEVAGPSGRRRIACDLVAVGYGLVPNVELAQALGCRLAPAGAHPRIAVDDELRTSVPGVFAAGEACGIGGRECALIEGELAGHLAAGARAKARGLMSRRRHARSFAAWLQAHFQPGPEVHALATADTCLCRCEDVSLARIQACGSLREARLQTRCGMGVCQGRVCGTALQALGLFGNEAATTALRPPLVPARLDTLAALSLPESRTEETR
jgi:NADPH-dependent 2,4-dienoyl-CoA reductase/sulfur reductase-like enzyme